VTQPSSPLAFAWEDHHFVAGSPALDFANSVVYRFDARRRKDRFRTTSDVDAWAAAAGLKIAPLVPEDLHDVIVVREAIDRFYRPSPEAELFAAWQQLVRLYARHIGGLETTPMPGLLAVMLDEAVALRFSSWMVRVKACGGCGWLFIDRTRNNSKRWCISALCGNRAKARRHYHKKKSGMMLKADAGG